MYRAIAVVSVVIGLGLVSWAAPPTKEPPSPAARLMQRVDFDGIEDPRVTLSEALEKLTKMYDISFAINEMAFKNEQLQVEKTEVVGMSGPIPAMKHAPLSRVLRAVLSRIPVGSGATYLVRSDHLEITTGSFQRAEIWGKFGGPYLPLVNATLEKIPLDEAAQRLADQAEFNVMIDSRVGEKAKTPVSARLLNTPLDTALRLLCDSADLQTIHLDNVLYITSKANAHAWEARLEKEKAAGNQNPEMPNAGERKGPGRDGVILEPLGGA